MSKEAMKLALEAMNAMLTHMGMDEDEWNKVTFNQMREAIKALEEALAKQEQGEPVAIADGSFNCNAPLGTPLYTHPQPKQEQGEQETNRLIQQRDHAYEIIDKLCDAVLGFDRPEWSSAYFFEDAVNEVEEKMFDLEKQEQGEPYAIEAGFDNGDGTYSVRIERYRKDLKTHKDWKSHEKLLYAHPQPKQEQGEPVGFCKVLTMDDVADIIVNAQSRMPPYEINYMTVMQLTEKAVLEKFK